MAKLNISAFARHAGVSRSALYKAINRGRIKIGRDRQFDTKHELNAAYITAHNSGRSKPDPGDAKPKPKSRSKKTAPRTKRKSTRPAAKKTARKSKKSNRASRSSPKNEDKGRPVGPKAKPTGTGSDRPPDNDSDSENGTTTRSQAELDKVLAQIGQIRVRTDKERQALIDRDLVRAMLGKLIAIDTNELLTLGSNISPDVAGICGKESAKIIMKIQKLIDERCYRVIKNRVKKMNDFLDTVQAKNIEEIEDE